MRAKWSAPIRRYWKISEQMMVKYCDLAICDSVNVSPLQEKINKTIRNEPEVEYHKDNEAFLKTVLSEWG